MSEAPTAKQLELMRTLQARFRATIGKTLDAIRQLGAQLAVRADAPEVLDALRRELHRVHGTAGSYGFAEASRLAGDAEARLVAWTRDPHLDVAQRADLVRVLVAALDEAFHPTTSSDERDAADVRPTILLVEGAAASRHALEREAAGRGFQVRALSMEHAQLAIMRDIAPALIAVPVAESARLADDAWDLGIPIVAMDGRPRAQREGSEGPVRAGITLVDVSESHAAVLDVAEHAAARAAARGVTVLALDDDPSILAMVAYVLEGPALTVRTLSDASELPLALETHLPSLLVSDIDMPGVTGIEVTRRLRADARYRDLPIVLLSSETDVESRDAALRAGADEFVSKPIAAAELRHRVADRLERHRLARLAALLHPVTALPIAVRTTREAAAAFGRLREADAACTVAVLRPLTGDAQGGEATGWLREVVRVARTFGEDAVFVGHHDGTALLLVLAMDSVAAASRFTSLAHGAAFDAPRWRVGLVERADLRGAALDPLRRFAEDAVDVARTSGDEVVHRWQPDEALIAPDVVVVEDDPALSDMLQYALRASGFTHRAFGNGRLALDFLLAARTQGRRPIVLLDVDLPGLDGYSLHERLAVERAGDYSVVFVTVHGAESDQLRALKGGAIDFVLKPLNLRILMAKMRSWAAAARPGLAST